MTLLKAILVPFAAVIPGVAIIAVSVFDPNDDNFGAPRWVAALAGFAFLFAGLAIGAQGLADWSRTNLPESSLWRRAAPKLLPFLGIACFYSLVVTGLAVMIPEVVSPSGKGQGSVALFGIPLPLPAWIQAMVDRAFLSFMALLLLGVGLYPIIHWIRAVLRRRRAQP